MQKRKYTQRRSQKPRFWTTEELCQFFPGFPKQLLLSTSARKVPFPNLLTQSCLASRFNAAMMTRHGSPAREHLPKWSRTVQHRGEWTAPSLETPFSCRTSERSAEPLKPTSAAAPSAGQDDLRERAILSDCLPLGAYSIQTCLNCRLLLHHTPPHNSHPRHTHAHITPRQPRVRTNHLWRFCCSVSTFCSFVVPGATLSFSINYLCSSKAMLIRIFLPSYRNNWRD